MRILAIETSCDETAIAIVECSGSKKRSEILVLANLVSSQVKLHKKFGGVVPNLAKREHQKNLVPLLIEALNRVARHDLRFTIYDFKKHTRPTIHKSKILNIKSILEREQELLSQFEKKIVSLAPPAIDAIAVTYGPGLAPALWVGVNFARALSIFWKKPLIPVNHMEGHFYSALLERIKPKHEALNTKQIQNSTSLRFRSLNLEFPALALLVSGGHTELVFIKTWGKYKIIGETLDDAAGEAFDKVARMLGLGYPGGPAIAAEAAKIKNGNEKMKIKLPRPMFNSNDYNFSFSGLKTAVLYLIRDIEKTENIKKYHPLIAKEFQDAVIDVLVAKTIRAAKEYGVKTVLLGGGVAANVSLQENLKAAVKKDLPNSKFYIPDSHVTGDNALMIGVAAYGSGKKKTRNNVQAHANLRLS